LRGADHGQDVADVVVEDQLIAAPHDQGEDEYEPHQSERFHALNLVAAGLRSIGIYPSGDALCVLP
jgi:hypothetical protein